MIGGVIAMQSEFKMMSPPNVMTIICAMLAKSDAENSRFSTPPP
ncbi:MAG TPA: hypothetical protein VK755_17085 [Candidatus Acidoferrales bacterium]|nr:hypothetical protein [Candidatus Acidoferrales bacterium]